MKQCHKCLTVWGTEQMICPICLTELQADEYSSEDADDGVFADPYTDADIIDDLAHECYTLRYKYLSLAWSINNCDTSLSDKIALIDQINGRTK